MIGKIQLNLTYQRKNIFTVTETWKILLIQIAHKQKEFNFFLIGEEHDFYARSHTLVVADGFNNFWNMSREISGLDPAYFLFPSGLVWQAVLQEINKGL